MKTCIICGKLKDDSLFYYQNKKDTGTCKDCYKERARKYRAENIESCREYDRERGKTEERKARCRDYNKKNPDKIREIKQAYLDRNPQKRKAHIASGNALRDGKIKKEKCIICGSFDVEKHHYDYSKPLNVIWLCDKHHKEHHKILRRIKKFEKLI